MRHSPLGSDLSADPVAGAGSRHPVSGPSAQEVLGEAPHSPACSLILI